jgi:hypothetical protein
MIVRINQFLQYLVKLRFPESCIQHIFIEISSLAFCVLVFFAKYNFSYITARNPLICLLQDRFLNCGIVLHNK